MWKERHEFRSTFECPRNWQKLQHAILLKYSQHEKSMDVIPYCLSEPSSHVGVAQLNGEFPTYLVDVPFLTSHMRHLNASALFLNVHTLQSQYPSSEDGLDVRFGLHINKTRNTSREWKVSRFIRRKAERHKGKGMEKRPLLVVFPVRRLTLSFQFTRVLDQCWSSQPPWTATHKSSIHWPSSSLVKRSHRVIAIRHERQLYLVGLLLSPIVQKTLTKVRLNMVNVTGEKKAFSRRAQLYQARKLRARGGWGHMVCAQPISVQGTTTEQHNVTERCGMNMVVRVAPRRSIKNI